MRVGFAAVRNFRDNVFPEVMAGGFIFVILFQQLVKIVSIKNIDAHAGERSGVVARHRRRVRRFFDEVDDFAVFINRHYPERARLGHRHTA